ncbi:hypothetical protein AWC38_SpisGene17912 [Stylophora pistillata]|uniref:Uncharacterized protein n=1 Tax=Stylophora pistillata TaxID=50429 RepID=A0A2B4RNB0_STYPI|nr:hypothetical protein AWC38_SpisGene17912 [Stylophora pistillata]
MSTDCRPTDGVSRLGGISVKCRWNIGQVSVVYPPSVGSLSAKCLELYRCGTSNKSGQKRPEKTVPEKIFKEAKNDLQAAMKQLKRSEEVNRKKEEDYQETIAALERRIEELKVWPNAKETILFDPQTVHATENAIFFVQLVSTGKSEQKSAATERDTDDGTDQTSDTDIGDDDFIEDDNWEKETKDYEEGAECAKKKD